MRLLSLMKPMPVEMQRGDAGRLDRPHLPAHVREVLALADPIGHRLPILRVAVAERATDRGRRRIGIGDLVRHGVNRVGVHAVGQDVTVAVEDVAALGGHFHGTRLLPLGARRQIGVAEGLEVHQTDFDHRCPHEKNPEGSGKPALQGCAPEDGRLVGHARLRTVLPSRDDGPRRRRGRDHAFDDDRFVR